MSTKVERLQAVKDIIGADRVSNQDELLERLREKGFEVTQATLSRDLKFLKVGKVPDQEKGYVYVLPSTGQSGTGEGGGFPASGFVSIDFSGNLTVMKTLSGYASSITTIIDGQKCHEIVGTIAGDDTILIILREGVSQEELHSILLKIMPGLQGKL